jgi:DNA-binding transcriptional regulator YiaG
MAKMLSISLTTLNDWSKKNIAPYEIRLSNLLQIIRDRSNFK